MNNGGSVNQLFGSLLGREPGLAEAAGRRGSRIIGHRRSKPFFFRQRQRVISTA